MCVTTWGYGSKILVPYKKDGTMVETIFEKAYSIYVQGHSPRGTLMHHDYDPADLDGLFESLHQLFIYDLDF